MYLILEIGALSAMITIFLNYAIGKPAGEFSPYEIFSSYTVWLSIRRLKAVDLYNNYIGQYNENLQRANTKAEIIQLNNDFKKMLYDAADPFFTWERAVGMCPICTGFWITLFFALFFTHNFVELVGIIVLSHLLIRIFNKIL